MQAQIVGTFQSHHQAPPQSVIDLLNTAPFQATFVANGAYDPFAYSFTHPSITQQLANGVAVPSQTPTQLEAYMPFQCWI